jgi:hypothetical protein
LDLVDPNVECDGKLVERRPFRDKAPALEAVGLPGHDARAER